MLWVRKKCANCGSSNMKLEAWTTPTFHYFFLCRDCRTYTEFFINQKHRMFMYLISFFGYLIVLIPSMLLVDNNPAIAIAYFFAASAGWFAVIIGLSRLWYAGIPRESIPKGVGLLMTSRIRRRILIVIITMMLVALALTGWVWGKERKETFEGGFLKGTLINKKVIRRKML